MTDPDVVLTDVGLALLGAYLGRRLGTPAGGGMLRTAGAVVMGGLASAALWGAIFHAWFPAKTATVRAARAYRADLRRRRGNASLAAAPD
ncbi:MAG: hypothetical protein DMD55_15010 [Gemmatimonadetes bacterium]|nr:MAG: hypothetical protein DMD55_15010 [Gemmatimonadota bacterium]